MDKVVQVDTTYTNNVSYIKVNNNGYVTWISTSNEGQDSLYLMDLSRNVYKIYSSSEEHYQLDLLGISDQNPPTIIFSQTSYDPNNPDGNEPTILLAWQYQKDIKELAQNMYSPTAVSPEGQVVFIANNTRSTSCSCNDTCYGTLYYWNGKWDNQPIIIPKTKETVDGTGIYTTVQMNSNNHIAWSMITENGDYDIFLWNGEDTTNISQSPNTNENIVYFDQGQDNDDALVYETYNDNTDRYDIYYYSQGYKCQVATNTTGLPIMNLLVTNGQNGLPIYNGIIAYYKGDKFSVYTQQVSIDTSSNNQCKVSNPIFVGDSYDQSAVVPGSDIVVYNGHVYYAKYYPEKEYGDQLYDFTYSDQTNKLIGTVNFQEGIDGMNNKYIFLKISPSIYGTYNMEKKELTEYKITKADN